MIYYTNDMQTTQTEIMIKPVKFGYQRNGVSGTPFYTLQFDWEDSTGESGKDFLMTFETDETDEEIKIDSCRVINLEDPFTSWRGDRFGSAVESKLKQIGVEGMVGMYYDLKKLINQ